MDADSGRGIPLVELETTHHVRFVSDSQGWVAIDDPDLMGHRVFFQVRSHGYSFPADGFGFRGRRLLVQPGERARLEMKRDNLAERLYRVTGGGIYTESLKLGEPVPLEQPLGNAQVWGCDSVLCAVYRDRVYWFWGDTVRPAYPLGNFHMTGATSELPGRGGLAPDRGIDFRYFTGSDGFVRPMAQMPGEGPTWLGGLAVVRDAQGQPHLVAGYSKIRNSLETYQRGLVRWNDEQQKFEQLKVFDEEFAFYPTTQNHPLHVQHQDEDKDYLYFATPLPWVRVPATLEAYRDPSQYETFTCLKPATRITDDDSVDPEALDRDEAGRLRYAWRKDTSPLLPRAQQKLLEAGALQPDEALYRLVDAETGRVVQPHGGSVAWNLFRKRWILIFVESGGEHSFLGDVWYAEADSLEGPWTYARRIASHQQYSFYNPKHHAFFDQQQGRLIYFEGTYTHSFSKTKTPTPRYDYNQIMYRLDLDDPAVRLPVAVYCNDQGKYAVGNGAHGQPRMSNIAFFALDRPTESTIPIYQQAGKDGAGRLSRSGDKDARPLFYALDSDSDSAAANTVPLVRWKDPESGKPRISIATEVPEGAAADSIQSLGRVWKNLGTRDRSDQTSDRSD